jgi:hypothetical protein
MTEEQRLWGEEVRKAIAAFHEATTFGKRTNHGAEYYLPLSSPAAQYLAVQHLLQAVETLQGLVQLLADEMDRVEGSIAD